MEIKERLSEEFENELEDIGRMEVGSEEHKLAVDSVTKLADRIIEIKKLEDEKKDRFVKNAISIGTFVGSAAIYGLAFIVSTNFERIGSFTTEGGRISVRELLKLKSK